MSDHRTDTVCRGVVNFPFQEQGVDGPSWEFNYTEEWGKSQICYFGACGNLSEFFLDAERLKDLSAAAAFFLVGT